MTKRGKFFVIEGTDASGKKTQFELLAQRLKENGYDVATFDFPRYDQDSSYFVRQYLAGEYGGVADVGPYTSSLFYALDRYAAGQEIERALSEGKIVLANRFTGSNMAHQGSKFNHPQERKGYFIWLDNLEFETLGIPRPDLSFVLRVEPEIIKLLLDKRAAQDPQHTTDIHEADLGHITRAVTVYDDICALFPKDFVRIDCVRSNRLMKIEHIQEIVWSMLERELPPPPKRTTESPLDASRATSKYPQEDAEEAMDERDSDSNYKYVTPGSLDLATTKVYEQTMDHIFDLYSGMVRNLTAYLRNNSNVPKNEQDSAWRAAMRARACNTVRNVLPVAAKSTEGKLLGERRKVVDKPDRGGETASYLSETKAHVRQLADGMLPATHVPAPNAVDLVSVWPRNELDLVADILYEHSNMSLREIQAAVSTWTYDEKERVYSAYMGKRLDRRDRPGRALEKAHYSWDIVCDYGTFRDLQRHHTVDNLTWQDLTPRYGYEMPDLIEQAGLIDPYEQCFELSLKLHDILIGAGYETEAQYATLLGHKMRWNVTYNARQAFHMHEHRTNPQDHPGYRKLINQMHEKLADKHPLLAAAITFVNKNA